MEKILDYYFSPSSPWTYLGHARFLALAAQHGARINVKPIDLTARVFPASGGLPVKHRPPQRQAYRLVELRRWSAYLGVPLNLHPRFFPVATNATCSVRLSTSIAMNRSGARTGSTFSTVRSALHSHMRYSFLFAISYSLFPIHCPREKR